MEYFQKFTGIVLFRQEYKEHDMIVKIFSREFGKQMFFVRNLQRSSHPLSAATLPFTRAVFIGTIHQNGFSFIRECLEVQNHRRIYEQIEVQAVMTYMMQLVDAVMEDRIVNTELYDLLENCIRAMENDLDPFILMHYFELKMLKYFGVAFQWQQCCFCEESVGPFDISLKHHGLLCSRHYDNDEKRLQLSPKAVHIARLLVAMKSPLQIQSLSLSSETKADLKRLCDSLMDEYVGIRLKGKKFIDQMEDWQTQLQIRRNKIDEK